MQENYAGQVVVLVCKIVEAALQDLVFLVVYLKIFSLDDLCGILYEKLGIA